MEIQPDPLSAGDIIMQALLAGGFVIGIADGRVAEMERFRRAARRRPHRSRPAGQIMNERGRSCA